MANWQYTIDLKPIWEKYENLDHEEFDDSPDLFVTMKTEMVEGIKAKIKPGHYDEAKEIITALQSSKHLSSFNKVWNKLYDYCDYKRIWLKTVY